MTDWRFVETDRDGELWLKNPNQQTACVEFQGRELDGTPVMLRTMIVTRDWLQKHLDGVRQSATGPLWAGIPSLLVVPNASGGELRAIVDRVIRDGGFNQYSTRIG